MTRGPFRLLGHAFYPALPKPLAYEPAFSLVEANLALVRQERGKLGVFDHVFRDAAEDFLSPAVMRIRARDKKISFDL